MNDLLTVSAESTGTGTPVTFKEPTPTNFLEIIANAASDPRVDPSKMMSLLDVQERMMNKKAQMEFDADFAKLQAALPRITKDAKIMHSGKLIASYATYDQIDAVIRPLLIEHGFGLRYNSQPNGNTIIIAATLSHKGGHSITDQIPLGIDASGAKNNVQGVGSTIAYGKRYLVGMLLNLVFEGEDDDGKKSGFQPMTDEQAAILKDLVRETNTDVQRFLSTMFTGVKSIDDIPAADYQRTYNTLNTKKMGMAKATQ